MRHRLGSLRGVCTGLCLVFVGCSDPSSNENSATGTTSSTSSGEGGTAGSGGASGSGGGGGGVNSSSGSSSGSGSGGMGGVGGQGVTYDWITDLQDSGHDDAQIKTYLQNRLGNSTFDLQAFPDIAVGESFRTPYFGFTCVRVKAGSLDQANGEVSRVFADGSGLWAKTGSKRIDGFALADGSSIGTRSFTAPSSSAVAYMRSHWGASKSMMLHVGGQVRLVNFAMQDDLYWDLTTGPFGSFIIGEDGGFEAGGDHNDHVSFFDANAGKDRTLFLMTSNTRREGAFVVDYRAKMVIRQSFDAAQKKWTLVEVAPENRGPHLWNLPTGPDVATVAVTGDHLLVTLSGDLGAANPGTWAYDFEGKPIGEITNYSSHTETFYWESPNGEIVPAIVAKGTAGTPGTGAGDAYLQPYRILTANDGTRSVEVLTPVIGVDWTGPAVAGLAQTSAIGSQPDWLAVSMKPGESTEMFYGKDELFLIPLRKRVRPLDDAPRPVRLVQHQVLSQNPYARQVEQFITPYLPDGSMRVFFRSDRLGTAPSNDFFMLVIPPIPTDARLAQYL